MLNTIPSQGTQSRQQERETWGVPEGSQALLTKLQDVSEQPMLRDFLAELFGPENVSDVWVASFPMGPEAWYGRRLDGQSELRADHNQYFSIGLIAPELPRGDGNVASHHVIVADDIGTKVTAEDEQKLRAVLGHPTWTVETSPGNFQWGWVLDAPILSGVRTGDEADTDSLKRLFAVRRYLVTEALTDKAVQDKSRYMRLPWGLNTKEKYAGKGEHGGFPFVTLREWNPGNRINLQDVCQRIWGEGCKEAVSNPDVLADIAQSNQNTVYDATMDDGLIRLATEIGLNPRPGAPGRINADCPNIAAHTPGPGAETGFAFLGGDRASCRHDACKGLRSPDFKQMIFDLYNIQVALGQVNSGTLPRSAVGVLMNDRPVEELRAEAEALAIRLAESAVADAVGGRGKLISSAFLFDPITHIVPSAIPPRRWLYARSVIAGFIHVLVAPGGAGKSSLAMTEAVAMASGRELLAGDKSVRPLRVHLHNAEDDLDEMQRRLAATVKHFGLSFGDLAGNFSLTSGRDLPFQLARMGRNGPEEVPGVADTLIQVVKAQGVEVLVLDPLGAVHGLPENDNSAMNHLAGILRRIANETRAAIILVHHTSKAAASDMDAAGAGASRGASAIVDAARVVRQVVRMTSTEASRFGVAERDRRSLFRVENGKANLAPAVDATWSRLVSVGLQNGTPDYPDGDFVAVAERWMPPGAVAGTRADLKRVQDEINALAVPPRADARSTDWVGYVVATALHLDVGLPGTKAADRTHEQAGALARINGLLSGWLAEGALVRETVKDQHHKERIAVRVGIPVELLNATDAQDEATDDTPGQERGETE